MPDLLSLKSLSQLPPSIRPRYDPSRLRPGIVHLGCGAFHRAHQAVYTEQALNAAGGDWGIVGASLRQPEVRDHLRAQDGLYTVLTRGADSTSEMVVGCMRDVVFAPDDRQRLPCLIASPEIRIVSLTITEKGYCLDPASGALDFSHPDIRHDVRHPDLPASAVGTLAAGLRARHLAHGRPLTVLSCDNLQHNGAVLRRLVTDFLQETDADTAAWISANVSFPSTMVDRIVPATTPELLDEVELRLGVRDNAAVWGEPFKQWVIEDLFAAERPQWEFGGAQLVPDVKPYEDMKLRLLNSSNSLLAYLGYLAGYEVISQVMQDARYATLVRRFMAEEAAPALSAPGEQELRAYQAMVIERFSNPRLQHRCHQIAMDGSQKLPQRLLCTVRDNLAAGRPIRMCALVLAAWMRYVSGIDENGKPIVVQDPLAAELCKAAQGDSATVVGSMLALHTVFDDELARSARLRSELVAALDQLQRLGSRRTVAAYLEKQA